MSLVRFTVRNEYGLGRPELYEHTGSEDPKEVLNGVAVAGLIGILRQLGDLAEFAAEVFHGLQEEAMTTASRSHRLMNRVQHIEAALPAIEKALLAQTGHIHFAYTAGREWHPRVLNEQNHFIYDDLPRFIMDSYEECHDGPSLHLLDKFDTGGPGSCLRRYSDPTYFRRASESPIEAISEIQRDKKNHKIKKKSLSRRHWDISRLASMSNQSSRRQFTSLSLNGRTSSSRTASIADMAFKSDLQDNSNSCDSISGSGYTECLYNLSYSMKHEENASKESSSSKLTPHADTNGSVLSDGRSEVVHDKLPYFPSQEQATHGSSCVSWHEKPEILDYDVRHFVRDDAPEMIATNIVPDVPDGVVANIINFDRMDLLSDNIDNAEPNLSRNLLYEMDKRLEVRNELEVENEPRIERKPGIESELEMDSEQEIESEGDDYVDALNTIELESENDFEYNAKREVEQYSRDTKNDRVDPQPFETKHEVEQYSSSVKDDSLDDAAHNPGACSQAYGQSYHAASDIRTNERISCSLPDMISSVRISNEQILQVSNRSSDLNHSSGTDFGSETDVPSGTNGESAVIFPSLSNPGAIISDSSSPYCISYIQYPRESQVETFQGIQTVKLWTNGSLLGLEPSKPPVFAVPNSLGEDNKAENTVDVPLKASEERLDKLVENSLLPPKVPSCSTNKIAHPSSVPDACDEKFGNFQQTDGLRHGNEPALTETSATAPGTVLPVSLNVMDIDTGSGQGSKEMLSGGFCLSHKLLMNCLGRKDLFAQDTKSEPASIPQNTELREQRELYSQTIQETSLEDPFGHESPFDWLTSSPPLEQMKISFNPADSLKSPKLRLKFPNGFQSHESNTNAFHAFQLIPDSAVSLQDTFTNSDDDTFCRSSLYLSDDYPSDNKSEANSEQWEESDESPEKRDQELYDTFCGMPTIDSVSSTLQADGRNKSMLVENVAEPSPSDPLLDVPSFAAWKPASRTETECTCASNSSMNLQNPMEPAPPPLPPAQWRLSKTPSDKFEDKQQALQDAFKHAFSQKMSLSTGLKESPVVLVNENVCSAPPKTENKVHQKLNRQEDSKQNVNGKDTDMEDFLHQIQTKQFNLRRAVTTRLSAETGPRTNMNINVILEKANSIRQAVASDDGDETDTWSDT